MDDSIDPEKNFASLRDELMDRGEYWRREGERCRKMASDQYNKWTARAEEYEAKVLDAIRAVSSLEPAPPAPPQESGPVGEDALAEFMSRPGAVKWEGGECPVGEDVVVQVRYRVHEGRRHNWDTEPAGGFPDLCWRHQAGDNDIIAYRVIESETGQTPKPLIKEGGVLVEAGERVPVLDDIQPRQFVSGEVFGEKHEKEDAL